MNLIFKKLLLLAIELALIFVTLFIVVPPLLSATNSLFVVAGFALALVTIVYSASRAIRAILNLHALSSKQ